MMTHTALIRAALTLSALGSISTVAAYCNARYGYCIAVPNNLYPQGESDNSDGQVFLSRDAKMTLRVWGAMDISEASYGDQFNEGSRGWPASPGRPARVVTYKRFSPAFFVISGVENGKVFYQRTIFNKREQIYATYLFTYPDGSNADAAIKNFGSTFHF